MSNDSMLSQPMDEYRLESLLGRGGMASVYRAIDTRLNRYVAVKVINTANREDASYTTRFEREAQALARLQHPNVINIYRYGNTAGMHYIAMQYVEGSDLDTLLQKIRSDGQRMDMSEILAINRQICSAIDYIHQNGIIHRDIKPSNIMLDKEGKAILADFGLAMLDDVGTRGETFGSPQYISPEQAISSAGAVPQSDVYSWAVVLFEMFTGELPFVSDDAIEMAMMHMSEPPRDAREVRPELPEAVSNVLETALAKKPEHRFGNAEELRIALEAALASGDDDDIEVLVDAPSIAERTTVRERIQIEIDENPLPPLPAPVQAVNTSTPTAPAQDTFKLSPVAAPAPVTEAAQPLTDELPIVEQRSPLVYILAGAGSTLLVLILMIIGYFLFVAGGDESSTADDSVAVSNEITATTVESLTEPPTPTEALLVQPTATIPVITSPTVTLANTQVPTVFIFPTPTVAPTLTSLPIPAIDLEKFISMDSGASYFDADEAPGIEAPANSLLFVRIVITNSGTANLTNLILTNDFVDMGICLVPDILSEGGSFECSFELPAATGGQYVSSATITAQADGGQVSDTDSIYYFVQVESIPTENPVVEPPTDIIAEVQDSPVTLIAFVSERDANQEIYVMDIDGSNQRRLTNNAVSDREPAWSPDGTRIAFTSERDGNEDIYIMNADGSDVRRLTDHTGPDNSPTWSPDGTRIAYASERNTGWDIYSVDINTGNVEQITSDGNQKADPAWSPDGTFIAYWQRIDNQNEIYIGANDGSQQWRITNNRVDDGWPRWTSDGFIIFDTYRDGNWEVYIMDSRNSERTNLTQNSAIDGRPAWSAWQWRIAFGSDRDGGDLDIYTMLPDRSSLRRLTTDPADDHSPAWQPDAAFTGEISGMTSDIQLVYTDESLVVQNPDNSRWMFLLDVALIDATSTRIALESPGEMTGNAMTIERLAPGECIYFRTESPTVDAVSVSCTVISEIVLPQDQLFWQSEFTVDSATDDLLRTCAAAQVNRTITCVMPR